MFVQVIEGHVGDADLLRRQGERWVAELKPGAAGFLGSTVGVTPEGVGIAVVRFDSEDAARRNSERPEQAAWWAETEKAYDGDIAFHDCREVDTALGGGSDDAGFVQVIEGRAKDQSAMRSMLTQREPDLHEARPDILGITVAWHGDGGGFTQIVYFSSLAAAREAETAASQEEMRSEYMDMFDGPPSFHDLLEPQMD